jgi:hypothetical protein
LEAFANGWLVPRRLFYQASIHTHSSICLIIPAYFFGSLLITPTTPTHRMYIGGYDESAADMEADLHDFAVCGYLNVVGGCCGSTPAHVRAIKAAVDGVVGMRVCGCVWVCECVASVEYYYKHIHTPSLSLTSSDPSHVPQA